jgi:Glycosyl hydrolase family 76
MAALLCAMAAAARADVADPRKSPRLSYISLAKGGLHAARSHLWNRGRGWYQNALRPNPACPLATVWGSVGLFEAISAVAIAEPTPRHRDTVRWFASMAERYWAAGVGTTGAYAAYPDNTATRAYFDDNGWWGLAFVDAYAATRDDRYLADAARALRFLDTRGWDGDRGMLWNTWSGEHSLATFASATALAAELYEYTGRTAYRRMARAYLAWGDAHALARSGLYASAEQPATTYVQGALIGAALSLCRRGDRGACTRAEQLAATAAARWEDGPYTGPQFDAILLRYLIRLSDRDGDPRWYDWAQRAAADAAKTVRDDGLYMRFWDGSKTTAHGHGWRGQQQFAPGQLHTHASTVSLFAWLAAVDRPD